MMKISGYLLLISVLFSACKDENGFTIDGKFSHATPKSKVYLFDIKKDSAVPLDSTVFSEQGDFQFTHSTKGTDFFRIAADNKQYMIIAKNGDQIKITADLTDKNMAYSISGSQDADQLEVLNKTKNQYMSRLGTIQAEFDDAVAAQPDKRDAIMERIRPKYTQEIEALNAAVLKFAQANSKSLAGFYAINLLNPSDYEADMIAYADQLKGTFNDNTAVSDFLSRMTKLKAVQVGQLAPEFTIDGQNGKPVKLSDYKGRYVMVDFWASWCMPCRQENPNLVKAYQTYKNKNFTVLGISLDKDPVAWKNAITADKLAWDHASELKDFEGPTVRLYQVDAIPSSFLIDPNGKIIAKGLRGEALDAFLNKTLL